MKNYRPLLAVLGLVLATDGVIAWLSEAGTGDWALTWIAGSGLIAWSLGMRLDKPDKVSMGMGAGVILVQALLVIIWGDSIGAWSLTGSVWRFLLLLLVLITVTGIGVFSLFVGRASAHGANLWIAVLSATALVILLNYVASNRLGQSWDMTEGNLRSLSEQTVNLLNDLNTDITVTAFLRDGDSQRVTFGELLTKYQDISSGFDYTIVDPDKNPVMAQEYDINEMGYTIVVETASTREVISETDERALTGAIIAATRSETNTVYVTQWHGEPTFERGLSAFKAKLEELKYEVKTLNLAETKVPTDAKVVCIIGPRTPFLTVELSALSSYLAGGGKMLLMLDPDTTDTGLDSVLVPFGAKLGHNVAVEPELGLTPYGLQIVGVNTYVRGTSYGRHEIVKDLQAAGVPTSFTAVQTVSWSSPGHKRSGMAENSFSADLVLAGTPSAWLEDDVSILFGNQQHVSPAYKVKGPHRVAIAITADPIDPLADQEQKTRIILVGDSDIATDRQFRWGGNGDFVVNSINWLAQSEELISIQPKTPGYKPITLTQDQGASVFLMSIWRYPALIFFLGMALWWRRRQR